MLAELDYSSLERALCEKSLVDFVQRAWPVLEPGQPLVMGWHVGAVCDHLEAVTDGRVRRLLINVPPGTMKSTLCNVFWPAWEWARGNESSRIISASHEVGLATRDTLKMRRLIQSDWYQELWPTELVGDQNQKQYYENASTGWRAACPVKSMTGRRGDRVILDDPHSVEAALSEIERETTLREFKETLPTRLNNPDTSAIVVVMQRLHEEDISGEILNNDYGYTHLCLPMEYEATEAAKTPNAIGFVDPRTEEGELLFPERFPREVVEEYKKVMGAYAYAGQMQQRPAPRTDGFFEWDRISTVEPGAVPKLGKVIRYWDKAGTEGGGAYTAGVLMGKGADGCFYVMDSTRGQWAAPKRERVIRQIADTDGKKVRIWIEQEPGSGGKEAADATSAGLIGFTVKAERPTGDKAVRAEPYAVAVEAGLVKMVRGDWNDDFLGEHKTFPVGKYKDQIDAASGGFNKLASGRYSLNL